MKLYLNSPQGQTTTVEDPRAIAEFVGERLAQLAGFVPAFAA